VFLPGNDLITRVKKRRYDLTIDLNLDLVLPSAYICKESDARIRVGFARKHADTFYNFQINVDPTLDRKLVYERLVKCLQMF
jgi:ADP-heptose:LPS heptosyltransferase